MTGSKSRFSDSVSGLVSNAIWKCSTCFLVPYYRLASVGKGEKGSVDSARSEDLPAGGGEPHLELAGTQSHHQLQTKV